MSTENPSYQPLLDGAHVQARSFLMAGEDFELRRELIRLRRAAGLTQADVAEMLGVSVKKVHNWERYDSDLHTSTIRRLANAVGATITHTVTVDDGSSVALAER